MRLSLLTGILLAAFAGNAFAVDRVGNFGLIDADGDFHQLSKYAYLNALVIVSQANGCEANYNQNHKYKLLETTWKDQGVEFPMLNASDERDAVAGEAELFDYEWPIMVDDAQLVANSLGIEKAGEIVVLDPSRQEILYRGPLDQRERAQQSARTHVDEALERAVAGTTRGMETVTIDAPGCAIDFETRDHYAENAPDYVTDVAPILRERCANCHRQGGIAPFAMDSHHMVARVVEPGYDREADPQERGETRFLEGFAPGKDDATVFPEGAGVFIPEGYRIEISEHYTTTGREATDQTAIGLYFAEETPKHEFRTYALSHGGENLEIPAGAGAWRSADLGRDVHRLLYLQQHPGNLKNQNRSR